MKVQRKLGDIFLIPATEDMFLVGQIMGVHFGAELYVGVWDTLVPQSYRDIEIIVKGLPWIGALTLDALIWHGRWPIIGNRTDNIETVPQPYFKLREKGTYVIVGAELEAIRGATADEVLKLRNKTVVAPIHIQKAVEARCGQAEWTSDYDELLIEYAINSSAIAHGGEAT